MDRSSASRFYVSNVGPAMDIRALAERSGVDVDELYEVLERLRAGVEPGP